MEKKINIAELLKNCPKGMELDCTIYDNVEFEGISDNKDWPIVISVEGYPEVLNPYGCISYRDYTKCVIYPKGKTTWEGFHRPFEDGDIVTYEYENGLVSMILKKFVNFVEIHHYCALYDNAKGFITNNYIVGEPKYTHFATEEEKQILFKAIKDNGYKWNADTKTLEKLIEPKFKVGDRVKSIYNNNQYDIIGLTDTHYTLVEVKDKFKYTVPIVEDKDWELVPNKFDISTLKPFDKVLARDTDNSMWIATLFSHLRGMTFYTVSSWYNQCIPFQGNEHLRGTRDNCNEYYRVWE